MTSSSNRIDIVKIDTREKKNGAIETYLDTVGLPYFRSKMYVGDYKFVCNPYYVIDRKKDMSELYGNLTTQHKRFRDEMKRAQESGIQLVVLVQEEHIKTLDDVKTWKNPQARYSTKALDGEEVYKRLYTMQARYGCEFLFCQKDKYPQTVIKLLREARNTWLRGIAEIYNNN